MSTGLSLVKNAVIIIELCWLGGDILSRDISRGA